jgi:hypothetical protein
LGEPYVSFAYESDYGTADIAVGARGTTFSAGSLQVTEAGRNVHRKGPIVLVGIFTTETPTSSTMRKRILSIFELRNDTRVCPFSDFRRLSAEERRRSPCELIYTFVLGAVGNQDHSAGFPTIIAGNDARPLVVNRSDSNSTWDKTILNIRENMNEGKSPTWFNYGASVAEEYGIEYVAKCDEDSILNLT